jgi:hypothetical protein
MYAASGPAAKKSQRKTKTPQGGGGTNRCPANGSPAPLDELPSRATLPHSRQEIFSIPSGGGHEVWAAQVMPYAFPDNARSAGRPMPVLESSSGLREHLPQRPISSPSKCPCSLAAEANASKQ